MPEWKYGVCDCCSTCYNMWCVVCCGCIPFGESWGKEGGSCCLCGTAYFIPYVSNICLMRLRGKIRESRGIEGDACTDCLLAWCCGCCTLIQIANELDDHIERS